MEKQKRRALNKAQKKKNKKEVDIWSYILEQTVEEAIQKGLNDLDIPRMKAHITVVAREKKGFLGLFGKNQPSRD